MNNSTGATKVSYGSVDHSAVTTSTANYFSSKWGPSARFKHTMNDCPYSIQDLHYYPKTSVTISGSTPLCSGSPQSFSATNWQSGNYYWDKSSNLSLSSPVTNSTVTVSTNGTGAGYVYVKDSNGTICQHNVVLAL